MIQVTPDQFESFDYTTYNRLLSPEEASEKLDEKDFKVFLAEACTFLGREKNAHLEKLLGLLLLHRHFEVKLCKNGLEKVLSIAILDRSWHSNYPSDQKFLQITYDEPNPANVLDESSAEKGKIQIRTALPLLCVPSFRGDQILPSKGTHSPHKKANPFFGGVGETPSELTENYVISEDKKQKFAKKALEEYEKKLPQLSDDKAIQLSQKDDLVTKAEKVIEFWALYSGPEGKNIFNLTGAGDLKNKIQNIIKTNSEIRISLSAFPGKYYPKRALSISDDAADLMKLNTIVSLIKGTHEITNLPTYFHITPDGREYNCVLQKIIDFFKLEDEKGNRIQIDLNPNEYYATLDKLIEVVNKGIPHKTGKIFLQEDISSKMAEKTSKEIQGWNNEFIKKSEDFIEDKRSNKENYFKKLFLDFGAEAAKAEKAARYMMFAFSKIEEWRTKIIEETLNSEDNIRFSFTTGLNPSSINLNCRFPFSILFEKGKPTSKQHVFLEIRTINGAYNSYRFLDAIDMNLLNIRQVTQKGEGKGFEIKRQTIETFNLVGCKLPFLLTNRWEKQAVKKTVVTRKKETLLGGHPHLAQYATQTKDFPSHYNQDSSVRGHLINFPPNLWKTFSKQPVRPSISSKNELDHVLTDT